MTAPILILILQVAVVVVTVLFVAAMASLAAGHRGRTHRALSGLFLVCGIGTVVTGVFYLPSQVPEPPQGQEHSATDL